MSSLGNPSALKRQRPSNGVDRISKLPESVLYHILSFLPTEEVVATSLVSRRWRFMWRNTHNLIFDDATRRFKDKKIKFTHFVNKVLIGLNQKAIEKFSLDIKDYSEMYDVSTWIDTAAAATRLKVLQFHLMSSAGSVPRIQLPSSIFICKKLESLVLKGVMNLNVPSSVYLPNLKYLRLECVIYKCGESVSNLISGCSSLDTLYIVRITFDNVVAFSISSPTLRKLVFRSVDYRLFPGELSPTLEINAPRLRSLDLSDNFLEDFYFDNLSLLEEADVGLGEVDESIYTHKLFKLLQGVCNVQNLTLCLHPAELPTLTDTFPSFSRVIKFRAYFCEWGLLLELVKGMDKLEFLTVLQINTSESCWVRPEQVPKCFLSCLQEVSIVECEGREDELAFVAYVLKNAKVLKNMIVRAKEDFGLKDKYELLQNVAKFPRVSECEITFS